MFESLKKKFSSLIKKKEEPKKEKETKEKKKTSKKTEKTKKEGRKETKKKTKDTKKEEKKKTIKAETEKDLKSEVEETPKEELIEELSPKEPETQKETKEETEKDSEEETTNEESSGFFSKLKKKLSTSVLKESDFEEIFYEFEITLLENNVALEAVDKIKESLQKDLVGISVKKSEIEETILTSLKEAITSVLIEPPNLIEEIEKSLEPYVILFFGINGSGKTTSVAKVANRLKAAGISTVMAAGDTFRAASIEQLETHGSNLDIPVIKQTYGSDPAAVAFDAIQYAKKNKIKAVLIDTAGRMYTASNLLREMEKIVKISKPNLKLFVGESITGNDATEQAKTFNDSIGIEGIILSKADIDEKAGTILSVSQVTGKPIYFLGTGQEYENLEMFSKDTVLKNLGLDQ